MDNDVNSRYPYEGGIEERLNALARSNIFTIWDKITAETFLSWCSNLSEMELVICKWIFYSIWDLNSANSAMYIEVAARLLQLTNIFANKKEIDGVIKKTGV